MTNKREIMPKSGNQRSDHANRKVVVIAYDGLTLFEFGIATEVFGLNRPEVEDWYRYCVVAAEPGLLTATGGVKLAVDGGLELLSDVGTIIVPGWRGAEAVVPKSLVTALCAAHAAGARLVSICSGVFVLAATGLLDGRRATTHWRYTDALARQYPEINIEPDVLYVDEGDVLTSAGSAAGIDLCLHIVRNDHGPEVANLIARRLIVPAHRSGGQAQYIEMPVPPEHEAGRIGLVLDQMRSALSESHSVARLSKLAGMSNRTFLRRFEAATGMTPSRWLIQERVRRARELLEVTRLPVETIAVDCGFGTTATMRHHFRRCLSTRPIDYRSQFSRSEPSGTAMTRRG
ncbi:transcriptional regulator FtrA [Sphingomonas sp. G124]|uniref:Transcriptional regulator FtrA n=1 Tax=Sphingomonas cremea TaxID=2904799 RepID=A0A9X1TZF0_9SPHN|nr:transcriptional regulator FtrA [Sphingomonas cremea]MCF2515767.1 transcriptional regulator FtrA [Sphingomonas cremea]